MKKYSTVLVFLVVSIVGILSISYAIQVTREKTLLYKTFLESYASLNTTRGELNRYLDAGSACNDSYLGFTWVSLDDNRFALRTRLKYWDEERQIKQSHSMLVNVPSKLKVATYDFGDPLTNSSGSPISMAFMNTDSDFVLYWSCKSRNYMTAESRKCTPPYVFSEQVSNLLNKYPNITNSAGNYILGTTISEFNEGKMDNLWLCQKVAEDGDWTIDTNLGVISFPLPDVYEDTSSIESAIKMIEDIQLTSSSY